MIEKNNLAWSGKKVLVMGLGLHGGGVGTVKFLASRGATVTITDLRKEEDLSPSLKQLENFKELKYTLGWHDLKDFLEADLIIKGPGVKPSSEFLTAAREKKIPITNDIGIFLQECPAKIIWITGTRGKSTTAFLLAEFLKTKFPRVRLAGNIRKSVLEILPEIQEGDWVVLELSSFQLQDLSESRMNLSGKPRAGAISIRGKPEIAVITNIFPDHLNWHKNFEEYKAAKEIIFAFQNMGNYLFINPDDKIAREMASRAKSRVVMPTLPPNLKTLTEENLGEHYMAAVALACGVAEVLGIDESRMETVLKNFHGLEGRQEKIAEVRGITFINDTTATMPEAAVAAIERFRKKAGPGKLILIAGGQDKGLEYEGLVENIKKSVNFLILLPGSATEKIKKGLEGENGQWQTAGSMEEAARAAIQHAEKGDWVVLSPGAASFGLFLNEFDRGDKFIQEVKKIK